MTFLTLSVKLSSFTASRFLSTPENEKAAITFKKFLQNKNDFSLRDLAFSDKVCTDVFKVDIINNEENKEELWDTDDESGDFGILD